MAKIVTVEIEKGQVSVDLAGYSGKGCHAVQEAFSQAFGGKTLVERRKSEYNKPLKTTNKLTR